MHQMKIKPMPQTPVSLNNPILFSSTLSAAVFIQYRAIWLNSLSVIRKTAPCQPVDP
jgi:hypothetical protein